jgi:hypothetical protein
MKETSKSSLGSPDTIITILLLIFANPIGLIVMWFLPKWRLWIKVAITSFEILAIVSLVVLIKSIPSLSPLIEEYQRPVRECINKCNSNDVFSPCIRDCQQEFVNNQSLIKLFQDKSW